MAALPGHLVATPAHVRHNWSVLMTLEHRANITSKKKLFENGFLVFRRNNYLLTKLDQQIFRKTTVPCVNFLLFRVLSANILCDLIWLNVRGLTITMMPVLTKRGGVSLPANITTWKTRQQFIGVQIDAMVSVNINLIRCLWQQDYRLSLVQSGHQAPCEVALYSRGLSKPLVEIITSLWH